MLNNLTECEEGDGGPNSQGEWSDPAIGSVCADDEQMCLFTGHWLWGQFKLLYLYVCVCNIDQSCTNDSCL